MGDFDEISRALGRIEGTVQETSNRVEALFSKHDKISEEQIEQRGALKLLAVQHAETTKKIVMDIQPAIDSFKDLKSQGKGALFGVGFSSGALGAGVTMLLHKITGH